ncbi:hypothetical protein HZU77_015905 [Neisseriaceae bacterium TC5R-5]|nr:hypothetical protein [Neisseriaceae bacterium TC5R-5]
MQLLVCQQTPLQHDTVQALAYLQCLLAGLGSECGEWLNRLSLSEWAAS